jgi:hypothetical protein
MDTYKTLQRMFDNIYNGISKEVSKMEDEMGSGEPREMQEVRVGPRAASCML